MAPKRRTTPATQPASAPNDLSAALATLSAEGLRSLVHEVLRELDSRAQARVVGSIIARAARADAGFTPAPVSDGDASEVLAFVAAAARAGRADPADVDAYLQRGSAAFLRKDYASAQRIFGALFPPLLDGEIDLGQDELLDEVLGADVTACATQYVASVYMTTALDERAEAVRRALARVRGLSAFSQPLRELERVAVEPLPELAAFLPRWQALLARPAERRRVAGVDDTEDSWRREVVQRLEGAAGLAKVARTARRADDLRAWCWSLVEANDWPAALEAFGEAAELVTDGNYARGEFLDGAALAAHSLGRSDLPAYLERAWRASPSMRRLRRWLGAATTGAMLAARVRDALAVCPADAACQRALLLVLAQDVVQAAALLASAPGLGWSNEEHPGHLLFPLFAQLLCASSGPVRVTLGTSADGDDLRALTERRASPEVSRIGVPDVPTLLEWARVGGLVDARARQAVLAGMKTAAERRLAGVTDQKRRRQYEDAAALVAVCVACDQTGDTRRWAAGLQTEYRYFPRLRDALAQVLRTP